MENYTGDTYDTGTRSAVAGGTTTVITFASQFRGDDSLIPVIEEYHKLANGKSYCDYSFHVIISNPTKHIVENDLQLMVEKYGITSVKIYMTYKSFMLKDYQILEVMHAARRLGITTMVHAENADVIDWMTEHLEEKGMTAPYHHGTSRPPAVEAEATVSMARYLDYNYFTNKSSVSCHHAGRIDGYTDSSGSYFRRTSYQTNSRCTNTATSSLWRNLSAISLSPCRQHEERWL
jgi:dihydropyrimidinase